LFVFGCKELKPCKDLPTTFKSYKAALEIINSTEFELSDSCDTSKSSWIKRASFYSCDEVVGYFILVTKNNTYIHTEVPKSMWKRFKKDDSFGKYYNNNIKNKYQLKI